MTGDITSNNEMDKQGVRCYRTGDTVGCHFGKIKEVAFFTVNGQIVGEYERKSSIEQNPDTRPGKPIADMKGKIVPIIQVGRGDHIRANFGDKPPVYEIPTPPTETIKISGDRTHSLT